MLEINRLIAEVKERNDIRLEPGDPAFALVTLNQLILEDFTEQFEKHARSSIVEFSQVVQKTEARAGKALAEYAKAAAAEIRAELQRDIENASLKATEIVYAVHQAHSHASLVRWGAAGLIAGAILFGSGLWIGVHYLQ